MEHRRQILRGCTKSHTHAYSDSNNHRDRYSDSNAYNYRHCQHRADGYSSSNSNGHSYTHCYRYSNSHSNADSKSYCHAKDTSEYGTAAHSAATPHTAADAYRLAAPDFGTAAIAQR